MSMNAASNVTGVVADVEGLTKVAHDHGFLAFWDMAAYASLKVLP